MIQVASTNCVSAIGSISRRVFSILTLTGEPLSRALALASAVPSSRKQVPSGTRSLIATRALKLVPFWDDPHLVAALQAKALGVGDRKLYALLGGQEAQGGFSSVIGPAHKSR